jgi:hypothetical protein
MIDELNQAILAYKTKWQAFVAKRQDKSFFRDLKSTAVAWKVKDMADFNSKFNELRDKCDRIVLKWMNDRWVAKMHLKDESLAEGMTIIKLMQRRPGSSDAIGLDHVDFYSITAKDSADLLNRDENIKWTREENGNCKWISVWFADTEAKLRSDTVIDATIDDLQELNKKVLAK